MRIKNNISLKDFNTFGVNAVAKNFIEINSEEELESFLQSGFSVVSNSLILGGGSNILFTSDYDGLVIKIKIEGRTILREDADSVDLLIGAGETWHEIVRYCVERNYGGIENLALIPGSVGAAPVQNIGAYGQELKDTFVYLEGFDLRTGKRKKFIKDECHFEYRDSIFKKNLKNKFVITRVLLRLSKKNKPVLTYPQLFNEFVNVEPNKISIRDVFSAVCKIRSEKLPDPGQLGNAGSFFKNPEIPARLFRTLKEKYPDIPGYSAGESFKIPAAWLIEKCGLKGFRKGQVGTHITQPLVIVNYGNAAGKEIYSFACFIRSEVNKNFGIELEEEVNVI